MEGGALMEHIESGGRRPDTAPSDIEGACRVEWDNPMSPMAKLWELVLRTRFPRVRFADPNYHNIIVTNGERDVTGDDMLEEAFEDVICSEPCDLVAEMDTAGELDAVVDIFVAGVEDLFAYGDDEYMAEMLNEEAQVLGDGIAKHLGIDPAYLFQTNSGDFHDWRIPGVVEVDDRGRLRNVYEGMVV